MSILSLLSRGNAQVVKNTHEKLEIHYEPEDYFNWRSHRDFQLRRFLAGKYASLHNEVPTHKTYSTKRGPLVLYSEDLALPSWNASQSKHSHRSHRHRRKKFKMELSTLLDLTGAILAYGRKQDGNADSHWGPYLRFLNEEGIPYKRKIRPGYSPKRYLTHLLQNWDPNTLYKLQLAGCLRDSVQLQQLSSCTGETSGRHPDLSSTPLKYQRLPVFTYLPQWTNNDRFHSPGRCTPVQEETGNEEELDGNAENLEIHGRNSAVPLPGIEAVRKSSPDRVKSHVTQRSWKTKEQSTSKMEETRQLSIDDPVSNRNYCYEKPPVPLEVPFGKDIVPPVYGKPHTTFYGGLFTGRRKYLYGKQELMRLQNENTERLPEGAFLPPIPQSVGAEPDVMRDTKEALKLPPIMEESFRAPQRKRRYRTEDQPKELLVIPLLVQFENQKVNPRQRTNTNGSMKSVPEDNNEEYISNKQQNQDNVEPAEPTVATEIPAAGAKIKTLQMDIDWNLDPNSDDDLQAMPDVPSLGSLPPINGKKGPGNQSSMANFKAANASNSNSITSKGQGLPTGIIRGSLPEELKECCKGGSVGSLIMSPDGEIVCLSLVGAVRDTDIPIRFDFIAEEEDEDCLPVESAGQEEQWPGSQQDSVKVDSTKYPSIQIPANLPPRITTPPHHKRKKREGKTALTDSARQRDAADVVTGEGHRNTLEEGYASIKEEEDLQSDEKGYVNGEEKLQNDKKRDEKRDMNSKEIEQLQNEKRDIRTEDQDKAQNNEMREVKTEDKEKLQHDEKRDVRTEDTEALQSDEKWKMRTEDKEELLNDEKGGAGREANRKFMVARSTEQTQENMKDYAEFPSDTDGVTRENKNQNVMQTEIPLWSDKMSTEDPEKTTLNKEQAQESTQPNKIPDAIITTTPQTKQDFQGKEKSSNKGSSSEKNALHSQEGRENSEAIPPSTAQKEHSTKQDKHNQGTGKQESPLQQIPDNTKEKSLKPNRKDPEINKDMETESEESQEKAPALPLQAEDTQRESQPGRQEMTEEEEMTILQEIASTAQKETVKGKAKKKSKTDSPKKAEKSPTKASKKANQGSDGKRKEVFVVGTPKEKKTETKITYPKKSSEPVQKEQSIQDTQETHDEMSEKEESDYEKESEDSYVVIAPEEGSPTPTESKERLTSADIEIPPNTSSPDAEQNAQKPATSSLPAINYSNDEPSYSETSEAPSSSVRQSKSSRARELSEKAERRRLEVERKRREREEQLRLEKEQQDRMERMKEELEQEQQRRAEEIRLRKQQEAEERQRLEQEKARRMQMEQQALERARQQQDEYRRKLQEIQRRKQQEELERIALERQRQQEQERLEAEERMRLLEMAEEEREEYIRKKTEIEEQARQEAEQRSLQAEAEARTLIEEAKRQAQLLARQTAALEHQLQFNRALMKESVGMDQTQGVSRPWVFSYFEFLELLGLPLPMEGE
ncbi:uncharacterized protein KIAA2012 homolog isoform X2 [Hyperolius riggenbachi]|uniref:uncharacterized protein KIAA2012 homolog isoform X2 n=1 Tax=Hyperolius riggenbachi TaxID=752182 RepID=UPI0035A32E2A